MFCSVCDYSESSKTRQKGGGGGSEPWRPFVATMSSTQEEPERKKLSTCLIAPSVFQFRDSTFEYAVYQPSSRFKRDFESIFPSLNVKQRKELLVVPVIQQCEYDMVGLTTQVNQERDVKLELVSARDPLGGCRSILTAVVCGMGKSSGRQDQVHWHVGRHHGSSIRLPCKSSLYLLHDFIRTDTPSFPRSFQRLDQARTQMCKAPRCFPAGSMCKTLAAAIFCSIQHGRATFTRPLYLPLRLQTSCKKSSWRWCWVNSPFETLIRTSDK